MRYRPYTYMVTEVSQRSRGGSQMSVRHRPYTHADRGDSRESDQLWTMQGLADTYRGVCAGGQSTLVNHRMLANMDASLQVGRYR